MSGALCAYSGIHDSVFSEETKNKMRGVLSFTLAHELGHLIEQRLHNTEIFSSEYKKPLSSKVFSSVLKIMIFLSICSSNCGLYKRELIADLAGLAMLSEEIKGKSVRESIKVMRTSMPGFVLGLMIMRNIKMMNQILTIILLPHLESINYFLSILIFLGPWVVVKFYEGKNIIGCGLKGAEVLQIGFNYCRIFKIQ